MNDVMIPDWWDTIRYFKPYETFEQGGVRKRSFPRPDKMDKETMQRLDNARASAGIPFTITSSYREDDDKAHGKGLAVDVRAHGSEERDLIEKALWKAGFPRRGVYDKHVHGDMDRDRPPGLWSGVSK